MEEKDQPIVVWQHRTAILTVVKYTSPLSVSPLERATVVRRLDK
jgi:hypothetical protein